VTIAGLAHEIRRLSDRLLTRVDGDPPSTTSHGALALELGRAFQLRPIDVDVALTVLGAEVDAEFRSLLTAALPRGNSGTELGILAALLPELEHRIAALDAVGPSCALVARGIVRRIEDGTDARLVASRRFRATALGRAVLSELPVYAKLLEAPPVMHLWVKAPRGLARTMMEQRRGALCIVSGPAGTGKTTWATTMAADISSPLLAIDLAAAAAVERPAVLEICELIEDAAIAERALVLDNAGRYVAAGGRLTGHLE